MRYLSVFIFFFAQAFGIDTYEDLVRQGIIFPGDKPALHLGCGDHYFKGYINIDFPQENRPVQADIALDYYCDIAKLCFPRNSVSKVENHHVFEHFSRPMSLAFLCAWHTWLCEGGTLVIETPDFEGGIQRYLATDSFRERQIILRHLFGSHEESWAVHWDGWCKEKFTHILSSLGFEIQSTRCFSWGSIDNIEVIAVKRREMAPKDLKMKAEELLRMSMVDHSVSENIMWEKWCRDFNQELEPMLQ